MVQISPDGSATESSNTFREFHDTQVTRMNIGYLTSSKWYPPTSGGAVHIYQLVSKLAERGHKIHTMFFDANIPNLTLYRQRHFLRFLRNIDVLYIRTDGRFGAEKSTLLKLPALFTLPVIWEINAPLEELLTFGSTAREVRALNRKRTLLAKLVDACACVSKEMKDYASNVLGINNCHIIPNGSDTELFAPEKRRSGLYEGYEEGFKVIWTGSSRYSWQGIDIVLDVARRMKDVCKEVVFVLITDKDNLSSACFDMENVVVVDHKRYFDLPPYMASADAALCLYQNYGWNGRFYFSPLKLFDYMACGLAVIGGNVGQISEVIRDGVNGLLVDGNDIDTLVEKILFLKNDIVAAESMGKQARQSILDYYNWERVARQTEDIMSSLVT